MDNLSFCGGDFSFLGKGKATRFPGHEAFHVPKGGENFFVGRKKKHQTETWGSKRSHQSPVTLNEDGEAFHLAARHLSLSFAGERENQNRRWGKSAFYCGRRSGKKRNIARVHPKPGKGDRRGKQITSSDR